MRIGYVPYDSSLTAPGDARRFCAYAERRGLSFEVVNATQACDLVILTERSDLSKWAKYKSGKIVYDLIDSYLSPPFWTPKNSLRGTYKYLSGAHASWEIDYRKSVASLCKRADAVICTTEEQKVAIKKYCSNVHVILDIHSSVVSTRKIDYSQHGDAIKIVWEGLGINVNQLLEIKNALVYLSKYYNLELHIVTDQFIPRYFGKLGSVSTLELSRNIFENSYFHPWNKLTCSQLICNCDLAVIPIDAAPLNRGKPENKMILLWKMGMPIISSSTPAYQRAMASAGLNLTCDNTSDWIEKLTMLFDSADLRANSGNRGFEYANSYFSEEQIISKWDELFLSIGFEF
jgi:hypothetical protein